MLRYCIFTVITVITFGPSVCLPVKTQSDEAATTTPTSYYLTKPDGTYTYGYEFDLRNTLGVEGALKDVNGVKVYKVRGSYVFVSPEGAEVSTYFRADENGFVATYVKFCSLGNCGTYGDINPKAIGSILG